MKNANIVLSSGKKAIIALSGTGIGPEHASRILATLTEGDAFYREDPESGEELRYDAPVLAVIVAK